jgi:hypothetical protein
VRKGTKVIENEEEIQGFDDLKTAEKEIIRELLQDFQSGNLTLITFSECFLEITVFSIQEN